MNTGETGIRSVAASLIESHQGALILRRTKEGCYEFTGFYEKSTVVCSTWPEAERVLVRLKVSPHQIDEIVRLLDSGTDVVMRRKTDDGDR